MVISVLKVCYNYVIKWLYVYYKCVIGGYKCVISLLIIVL